MTSFRELMAVPFASGSTIEPCVEISREGVACPDQPIVSNNAEDSGAMVPNVSSVSAAVGAALVALLM